MFLIRKDNLFFAGISKGMMGSLVRLLKIDAFRWTTNEADAHQYQTIFEADEQASVFRALGQDVTVEMRL